MPATRLATNKVVVGDIDDMSGVYGDIACPGDVIAAKWSTADVPSVENGPRAEHIKPRRFEWRFPCSHTYCQSSFGCLSWA
jgi:hypothetical protein